jgi:hypothetical protein
VKNHILKNVFMQSKKFWTIFIFFSSPNKTKVFSGTIWTSLILAPLKKAVVGSG